MNSEKLPPHDIDAEEAAIGSLLIDGTAIYKIATFLQQTDFYHEHRDRANQSLLKGLYRVL